ncbi:hypothetical protein [Lysinibacter sp. HNR]|uniref:hypothetical protein n=1 Tax=Lysinibacter sp. HNR TaxID=3031408 RepID=UPI00243552C5|nr:hypothetical protein [Lysinibacter sp. HNR]WGD36836.1 hypothetical protein FrondiHNR_10295 [Lysinibacter sp. HNR]
MVDHNVVLLQEQPIIRNEPVYESKVGSGRDMNSTARAKNPILISFTGIGDFLYAYHFVIFLLGTVGLMRGRREIWGWINVASGKAHFKVQMHAS